MKTYKLNETFMSIQGEGINVGTPSLFIRFAGCNLKCSYCDTDFSEKYVVGQDNFLEWLDERLLKRSIYHVILTGGEPLLQDIQPIIDLVTDGYHTRTIQIETNGTIFNKDITSRACVTVSPKSPDFKQREGTELKLVYTGQEDLEDYMDNTTFDFYYLQPCWKDGTANTMETYNKVMAMRERGWSLSLQVHKLIGVK